MIMDLHGLVIVKTTLAILLLQLVATKCVVLFPPSKANFNFMVACKSKKSFQTPKKLSNAAVVNLKRKKFQIRD